MINDVTTTIVLGRDHYNLQLQMEEWCEQQFGFNTHRRNWHYKEPESWEDVGNWGMSSMYGNTFFYFKNDEDAMLFALRWS